MSNENGHLKCNGKGREKKKVNQGKHFVVISNIFFSVKIERLRIEKSGFFYDRITMVLMFD